jgi:hypothetical protein
MLRVLCSCATCALTAYGSGRSTVPRTYFSGLLPSRVDAAAAPSTQKGVAASPGSALLLCSGLLLCSLLCLLLCSLLLLCSFLLLCSLQQAQHCGVAAVPRNGERRLPILHMRKHTHRQMLCATHTPNIHSVRLQIPLLGHPILPSHTDTHPTEHPQPHTAPNSRSSPCPPTRLRPAARSPRPRCRGGQLC